MATKWIKFIESDTRTKKSPDGFPRYVRADRIDAVSATYQGGGCTISVHGVNFHVEMDAEDVLEEIDTRGNNDPKPTPPVGYM